MMHFDNMQALSEGWGIFRCPGSNGGPWQIQVDDEMSVFESDDGAWAHVWKRSMEGSEYHTAALAFLREHNPPEYQLIVDHFLRQVLTPI